MPYKIVHNVDFYEYACIILQGEQRRTLMTQTLSPDALLIEVKLPDSTITQTAFSFGEYLALMGSLGDPLATDRWSEAATWLLRPDNHNGRLSIWSHLVRFRKHNPNNQAVKRFCKHAIKNHIPI